MDGRRILAVRSGALGDTVLALPALGALRALAGDSGRLEVVGTEPSVRLALGPRYASRVHSVDRGVFRALFHEGAADEELLALLRRFDLVVAWSNLPLLRSRVASIGIESIETSPLPPAGLHASEHLYRSLARLGVEPTVPVPLPAIEVDPDSRHAAGSFLASHGLAKRRFVAIHPSSGSARKNWRADGFREIAERARNEGLGVLWIAGEADDRVVEPLESLIPAPVARSLPLPILASVLADAGAYFGNDSGVTHLAAAVGVPTIAFFGPTDPRCWAPRGRSVRVVGFQFSAPEAWGKATDLLGAR